MLKAMQELNVHLDVDTYSTYVLPTFSSVDSARAALKVMTCVDGRIEIDGQTDRHTHTYMDGSS